MKRISGKSLREFADERIFQPLGMTWTHFHDDPGHVMKRRAMSYESDGKGGYRISYLEQINDSYGDKNCQGKHANREDHKTDNEVGEYDAMFPFLRQMISDLSSGFLNSSVHQTKVNRKDDQTRREQSRIFDSST